METETSSQSLSQRHQNLIASVGCPASPVDNMTASRYAADMALADQQARHDAAVLADFEGEAWVEREAAAEIAALATA
jgi:hypothetical protein